MRMSDKSVGAVRKDERQSFQPIAQQYRKHGYLLGACFILVIAAGIAAVAYHFESSPWFGTFVALCVVTGIVTMITMPKPQCTACGAAVYEAPQTYCPDCGGSPLEDGWFGRRCTSCHKLLSRSSKGRSYRVRYCTCCGAYLDDAGL